MEEIITQKRCKKCNTWKEKTSFWKDRSRTSGLAATCIDCQEKRRAGNRDHRLELARQWNIKNKERIKATRKKPDRSAFLMKKYQITVSTFEEMLSKQNGVCAICGSDNNGKTLHVDHCHETGKVRGLLCHGCNVAMGFIRDNENIALKMYEYLETHKE